MDTYDVNITEPAEDDLRDIARYISSQLGVPGTALNVIQAIKKAVSKLEKNALIYPLVRDDRLASIGYRSVTVKNYTTFYVVNEKEKKVDVDRILYSRRDWKSIV